MADQLFDLQDRNAYVTGAASGIGFAVAEAFAERGASVVLADIGDPTASAKAINGHAVTVDVSDEGSVQESFAQATAAVGPLDIVVLNAGIGDVGFTFAETALETAQRLLAVNQMGVLLGLKHAPGAMRDGGSIIATSSLASKISLPGNGVYSATKRAVNSLVATAAMELGERGIRVNAVCPGYTATALGSGAEGQRICEAFTALGRMATVEDLIGVYRFLAADASRYLTGQSINVDGGWSCGPSSALLELVIGSAVAPG